MHAKCHAGIWVIAGITRIHAAIDYAGAPWNSCRNLLVALSSGSKSRDFR
jgi:hypothetical protein